MARILLITNPSDDVPTKYLGAWSEKIINLAKQQTDTVVFSLDRKEANKMQVAKIIEMEKPQLILFNGHGDSESITGFNQEVLIRCNENEYLLANKIVHSLSCDSGKNLGPQCIKIGTLAYIGYKEKFKLIHLNKSSQTEMLNDDIANFFLQPAYEAVVALIEGATAEEAYKRSQRIYRDNLSILITSKDTGYNTIVASQLYHNMVYQVRLGKSEAFFWLSKLKSGLTVGKIKEVVEEVILDGIIPNEYEAAKEYFGKIKDKYLKDTQEWERA